MQKIHAVVHGSSHVTLDRDQKKEDVQKDFYSVMKNSFVIIRRMWNVVTKPESRRVQDLELQKSPILTRVQNIFVSILCFIFVGGDKGEVKWGSLETIIQFRENN